MSEIQDIHALADGELSGEAKARVELLVAESEGARSEYMSVLKLKSTLSDKLPTPDCSSAWQKCVERIRELHRTDRAERLVGKYSYAIAGLLMIAIVSAAYLNRVGTVAAMDADGIARTINANAADGLSFPPLDRAVEWVKGRLGASVPQEDVEAKFLQLKGVDTVLIEGRRVGRFLYTDGSTLYWLLVMPGVCEVYGDEIPGHPGKFFGQIGSRNAVSWCDGNNAYTLAAEKSRDELLRLIE